MSHLCCAGAGQAFVVVLLLTIIIVLPLQTNNLLAALALDNPYKRYK